MAKPLTQNNFSPHQIELPNDRGHLWCLYGNKFALQGLGVLSAPLISLFLQSEQRVVKKIEAAAFKTDVLCAASAAVRFL